MTHYLQWFHRGESEACLERSVNRVHFRRIRAGGTVIDDARGARNRQNFSRATEFGGTAEDRGYVLVMKECLRMAYVTTSYA